MPQSYDFEVRVFGCNIRVESACAEAFAILDRYISPTVPRAVEASGRPDIVIRAIRVSDQFQLWVDGVVVASSKEPIGLVPDLTRSLDEALVQRLTWLRAVHAGAVLWHGRALLFPGTTHAGKSSLVAELLRRGAVYLSDEYALIDSQGLVHAYPRPLLLRNGGPQQTPMLPAELGATIGDSPAPVRWILFLEYQPSYSWKVTPVSKSEALLMLLQNTPHTLADSPDLIGVLQGAVTGADSYVGRRPEAVHAVDQILKLVADNA